MKKVLAIIIALFFATCAYAQNAGTVANHAFALGKGPNVTGYTSLLCTSAQLAVGQAAADPICRTVTGDATLSAAGALTLGTVNANVGTFGSSTQCTTTTVNAKGLITAISQAACAGGGGTPGGTSGQSQWNNAGSFAGYTMSGDATLNTGTGALTLASVAAGGTFGSATSCVTVTNNTKGLTTAISAATCTPALGSVTGFGTGVAAALAINVGLAGAPVLFNGALGTPSAAVLTNATGLPTTGLTGTLQAAQEPAHTGDVTNTAGSLALALATVNANVGSFGSATQCTAFTTNAKGLITAASAVTCTPGIASVTGLGTGVGAALGVNVGSAGAFVTFNGALGTPSSGVGTNLTGTASGLTAGNATNTAITDDTTTNAIMFPTWVAANTGNLPQKVTSTKLSFNPSTGLLSATGFVGSGTRLTFTIPTPQVFQTAGSFTYTPTSCAVGTATWTELELSGGGGGGAGSGTTPGAPAAGGASSFGGLSCGGGGAGLSNGAPSAGGACTGTAAGDDFVTGGSGGPATTTSLAPGGAGGSNPRGGAGPSPGSALAGVAAVSNSGGGGSGAGDNTTALTGGGGAAGGWARRVITNPAGGTVVVGAAGTAGTAGTGGFAGSLGGTGVARFLDHCN